jgi:hypothetical protein
MTHWIGPYGIKVPSEINLVTDTDCCSLLKKDGTRIKLYPYSEVDLTEKEFKKEYAVYNPTDWYYYWDIRKEITENPHHGCYHWSAPIKKSHTHHPKGSFCSMSVNSQPQRSSLSVMSIMSQGWINL